MKRTALALCLLLLPLQSILAATPPPILRLRLPFSGPAALGVLDARPDVLSGDRKETFVGLSRSLYGIPYPAYTKSKQPLARPRAFPAAPRRAHSSPRRPDRCWKQSRPPHRAPAR